MAISRTIYTQGKVTLKTGSIGGTLGNFAVVSGVQNATFSLNTPRENVNSFGFKGLVDKVQVAPETATATFSYVLPKNDMQTDTYLGNANHLSPSKISGLMGDAAADTHSGVHVEVAGLGTLMSGVLSSFNINAAVGELATVEMTFEGVPSGGQSSDDGLPAKNSTITTATYEVLTPDRISGYLPDNALGSDGDTDPDLITTEGGENNIGNFGGCVRTATFSWEIPIETVQCLGESVSQAYRFSNPPGTSSLVLEGIDVPYAVSGLTLGDMRVSLKNAKFVSREHNMAVGEVTSTYNLTLEATALDALMSPTLTSN